MGHSHEGRKRSGRDHGQPNDLSERKGNQAGGRGTVRPSAGWTTAHGYAAGNEIARKLQAGRSADRRGHRKGAGEWLNFVDQNIDHQVGERAKSNSSGGSVDGSQGYEPSRVTESFRHSEIRGVAATRPLPSPFGVPKTQQYSSFLD